MAFHPNQKNSLLLGTIALILAIAGIATYILNTAPSQEVACTLEAKICPDGTAVGRTGPNCEFAACPESPEVAGWETFDDVEREIRFKYPADFDTQYKTAMDWPPAVQVLNEPFTCTEAGNTTLPGGETEQRTVNGREYCVTARHDGAAGTMYSLYAYATEKNGRTVILTFGSREPQCGNFDDAKRMECEAEKAAFDLDRLIDTIVHQTLQL